MQWVWVSIIRLCPNNDTAKNLFRLQFVIFGHILFVSDPKVGKYSPDDMRVIFNDSAPIMMITSVSHNDLNSKLKVKGRPEVQIDSWKSNIVLRCNLDQFPFCEDNWGKFSIAEEVTLDRVRLCHRCAVTKVDPKTGTFRKDEEPLRTLRQLRRVPRVTFCPADSKPVLFITWLSIL